MHGNTGAACAEWVAIVAVRANLIGVILIENGQLRCGARVETTPRRRALIIRLPGDVPGVAVPDGGGNCAQFPISKRLWRSASRISNLTMLTDIRRNGIRRSAQARAAATAQRIARDVRSLRVPQQYNFGVRASLDVGRQLVHGSAHPLPRTRDVVKRGWVNDVLVIGITVVRNDQICERSHVARVLFRRASGDQDVDGSAGRLAPSENGTLGRNGGERMAPRQQENSSSSDLTEHAGIDAALRRYCGTVCI